MPEFCKEESRPNGKMPTYISERGCSNWAYKECKHYALEMCNSARGIATYGGLVLCMGVLLNCCPTSGIGDA